VRDSFAPIDLAAVPGSGMWEVLVEVSDGFDAALSAPVTGWIAPKPPRSLIVRPAEGSTHLQSDTIDAYGIAADWEDDAVGDGMVWLLDGQAAGLGVHAQLSDLAPGQHLLQLVTSNQFNLQGSMAITFEIVADLQPPQPLQPPDGAQSVQSPVVLTWAGVPAGVSYRVQVASDASFTWIVAEAGGLVSSQSTFHRAQLGRTYWWRVRTEHPTAPSAWSAAFAFSTQEHPTAIDLASPASSNLRLRAHPNPFNPRTTIEYSLELEGDLQLAVFDVAGRHVRTLAAGPAQAGTHSVEWDGRNAAGRPVGSGVYLVRLESATATRVVRVSLLR
jgi:hypothetical protein